MGDFVTKAEFAAVESRLEEKHWRTATADKIAKMTLGEAVDIALRQIYIGEQAMKDVHKQGNAPRPHVVQALKLLVSETRANKDNTDE